MTVARRASLLSLVVVAALAPAACKHTRPREAPPAAPASEGDPAGAYYEVKAGDTLWSIARAHGLPVDELVEVNGLESADHLVPGQLLFLPDTDPLALPPAREEPAREAPTLVDTGPRGSADLAWPLAEGVILRDFQPDDAVPYDGLLLAAPQGTPVLAAAAGKVLYCGDEGTAFGTLVIVEHEAGLVTVYAHLDGVEVEPGERVVRGQLVGRVGSSGTTESPQLHFQVRSGRKPTDPLAHLPPP